MTASHRHAYLAFKTIPRFIFLFYIVRIVDWTSDTLAFDLDLDFVRLGSGGIVLLLVS